jgi:hypothetical protein
LEPGCDGLDTVLHRTPLYDGFHSDNSGTRLMSEEADSCKYHCHIMLVSGLNYFIITN